MDDETYSKNLISLVKSALMFKEFDSEEEAYSFIFKLCSFVGQEDLYNCVVIDSNITKMIGDKVTTELDKASLEYYQSTKTIGGNVKDWVMNSFVAGANWYEEFYGGLDD